MRRRNDGESLFWVEFRDWVRREIERGNIRYFTLKRLFKIFKEDYLPKYIQNKNGVHHAYYQLITFDDVYQSLTNYVVIPLLKAGTIERIKQGKYRANGHDRLVKTCRETGGESAKIPIREVDEGVS